MSISTVKSTDKIKLLDQLLEDIAGDEFEDFDAFATSLNSSAKHYADTEELELIDSTH